MCKSQLHHACAASDSVDSPLFWNCKWTPRLIDLDLSSVLGDLCLQPRGPAACTAIVASYLTQDEELHLTLHMVEQNLGILGTCTYQTVLGRRAAAAEVH